MQGRLNSFQLSMLQWNELHPYNAVHVVRIPEALDLERLKRAITATLEGKGLTGLALDRRAGTYQYHGGPASAEIKLADTRRALVAGLRGGNRAPTEHAICADRTFHPVQVLVVAAERMLSRWAWCIFIPSPTRRASCSC